MFFDTHCHLNFHNFSGKEKEIIDQAAGQDVKNIVVPGTDFETSKKALEIAMEHNGVYAAVGIHPHHIFNFFVEKHDNYPKDNIDVLKELNPISDLLSNNKVVAIGEVGIDRHIYNKTKYKDYKIETDFVKLQKDFLSAQIKLAIANNKSLILHNREAKSDFLKLLDENWDLKLEGRTVFHCCEPDSELLDFANKHKIFIGVDGDICYFKEKQSFIKKVPLDKLVLETDSPFLSPKKIFPNVPANIAFIAEFISKILGISKEELGEVTTVNAKKLFNI